MSILRTLTINGTKFNVVPVVPATSVTLLASAWVGNGDAYSQVVEVPGVTAKTKVDLQPTAEQLEEFHYKVLAFVAENEAGVVTVYSIGDKPTNDHTIQVTLTEVETAGKIRGNTVGTTMPRANLGQKDPAQADYIIGRDTIVMLNEGTSIAGGTDLNSLITIGNYKCTSASTVKTLLNCPVTGAFFMRVGSPAPGVSGYRYQELFTLSGTRYYRYTGKSGETWATSWRQTFDTGSVLPTSYGGMGADASSDLGEAEHLACCQRFVDKMNENAAIIGMTNTEFRTPSGLCTKPVNESKTGNDIAYNSYITAYDLLRLLVAARHTPTVLGAMGTAKCTFLRNGSAYWVLNIIVGDSVWTGWAEQNGYTILAAKGGSLQGIFGEIGYCGINNGAYLIQDANKDIFAVTVVGLQNPIKWFDVTYAKNDKVKEDGVTYISLVDNNRGHAVSDTAYWAVTTSEGDVLRTIIHDLIGMASGGSETDAIREANGRRYPVGMAVAKLTKNGTFDEDMAALASGVYYNQNTVRPAASVSKIMAAITALPYLGNHNCTVAYDDMVGGSGLDYLERDDVYCTADVLNVMLARSDNTMATLLARVCGAKLQSAETFEQVNAVLYDKAQQLTAEQKAQARANIGALGAGSAPGGGVGQSTTGVEYEIEDETVIAGDGAEIFNDYHGNIASGTYAHAEGKGTEASGDYGSHAEGYGAIASGTCSHAEGWGTFASGIGSHVEGQSTTAAGEYQHTQGKFNIKDTASTYAHIVGNGSGGVGKSNAHTLDWYGNAVFAGTVSGTGADYAEHFEWLDGNPDAEDRVGAIVTLEGDKIRFANAGDEILGIVSGTAMVIGDNAEWEWHNKYLTDSYGRVITEMVEEFVEVENQETGELEQVSVGYFPHRKINPEWNETLDYVRRCDRPEWAVVGLFGKLYVTDDGTCAVGGCATNGDGGVATASTEKTNIRVMKRISDNIVLVFMK